MKIGIIVGGLHPAALGGAEKQALELATFLSDRHSVYVFVKYFRNHIRDNPFTLEEFKFINLPILRYFHSLLALFLRFRNLHKKIDILFCFGTGDIGLKGLLINKFYRIPFIVSIRSENSITNPSIISRIILFEATTVHLQSDRLLSMMRGFYPIKNLVSISNGINFSKIQNNDFIKRNVDVIYVGRLISQRANSDNDKGVRFLIEALTKRKDISCWIVGDGPDRSRLQKMAKGTSIKFLGHIRPDLVPAYLLSSKVLILPSVHGEGFPNVVAEAMSCGTPVVSTTTGAIPDVVKNNYNGFLIKPKDSDLLLEKILLLLEDRKLWEKFSLNCLKDVEKYEWKIVGKQFEQLFYDEIRKNKTQKSKNEQLYST